jgi:hypothetical protein
MRTIILSFSFFIILSICSSGQNWFPLEVGNQWQYFGHSTISGISNYFIRNTSVYDSIIIDGKKYFLSDAYMLNNHPIRFDTNSNKIFFNVQNQEYVYMDFNIPAGQTFYQYLPSVSGVTGRTVMIIEGSVTLFGNIQPYKGYYKSPPGAVSVWYISNFGEEITNNTMIQSILISTDSVRNYDHGYLPVISDFIPPETIHSSSINLNLQVHHYFNRFRPPSTPGTPLNYIAEVNLVGFYTNSADTIQFESLSGLPTFNSSLWTISGIISTNLLSSGYSLFYQISATDKGIIPHTSIQPDTGYYKLVYDPSPAQILFSEDSIYIPTLSDSGFTKIVNTSDYPVRIDSINSVGAFYGYRGFLSKPGFEYPFYLFQTMPGFMGDTLGIIIPPHDSINVSFYDVDLCPVCDYEVQDYFKDTLRFVFTFLDGNVYSFSKSIPISGAGHMSDVEDDETLPKEFSLEQNYPNPFNPSTKISWQSPVSGWQTLNVYDVLGNEVATLVNEYRNVGSYEVNFDASKLSSGVYYYQLKAGEFIETKKMIYLK